MEEKQKVELTLPNPLNIAVQVPGLPGKDGKSAYEVAVERGFVGTVDEWLESLHGQNGSSSEPVSMNFPTVYQMMKARAMKVDSDSLEDLLKALLREVIPDGRYSSYLAEFKLVDGTSVAVGDTVVHVEGQPGFYVVDTNGNRQMIPDSGRLDFACYLLRSTVTRRFSPWNIRPVTTVRPLRLLSRQYRQGEAKTRYGTRITVSNRCGYTDVQTGKRYSNSLYTLL